MNTEHRLKTYHVATTGCDEHPGTPEQPLRTLQCAADRALPGDTVLVHEGLYRERVNPPRGGSSDAQRITFAAAAGERAELRGSEIITGWETLGSDTWTVSLPNDFFGDFNPFAEVIGGEWYLENKFPHHCGAVYLNGVWLDEAESKASVLAPVGGPPLWKAEVGATHTSIWAQFPGVNPNQETVEINVRSCVFYPDTPGRNFITVRGFILRHAATGWAGAMSEQVGLIGTHWSKGWVIEDNIISHSVGTGVTLGRYDLDVPMLPVTAEGFVISIEMALENGWSKENIGGHVVRNNHISHCEKNGIHGSLGGIFSLIEGNVIHDIAMRGWLGGFDISGLKLLGSQDAIIRNNHIYRCGSSGGIWLDWMAQGTRVSGNLLHDNSLDVFMEVNHGPFLIDHNLFLSSVSLRDMSEGGAYVHNLFAGKIEVHTELKRETPYHKPHSTELAGLKRIDCGDNRFVNNLFIGEACSTCEYDDKANMWMEGNVYGAGARPGRHDAQATVGAAVGAAVGAVTDADFVLEEQETGWQLRFPTDPDWAGGRPRRILDIKDLGRTLGSGLCYEMGEGEKDQLDLDYFGIRRNPEGVLPGPFAASGEAGASVPVWPK